MQDIHVMPHNPEMVKVVIADAVGERTFWVSECFNSDDCLDRAGEWGGQQAAKTGSATSFTIHYTDGIPTVIKYWRQDGNQ